MAQHNIMENTKPMDYTIQIYISQHVNIITSHNQMLTIAAPAPRAIPPVIITNFSFSFSGTATLQPSNSVTSVVLSDLQLKGICTPLFM
ncbi:hypothetical protein EB796_001191 [Bugula neritina]|uniref:Uncharacterized protein n=1 Tax=Bugula neritina TaxID=10212 RepID=A0A7J7KQR3_BUGNE|nr:hypothetical protein EB796_001191 [Bugula neritina]